MRVGRGVQAKGKRRFELMARPVDTEETGRGNVEECELYRRYCTSRGMDGYVEEWQSLGRRDALEVQM